MNRDELARSISDVAHLTGSFRLRSGQVSNHYFDKYQFEANPVLLRAIAEEMVAIVPEETEILAGLELGGVPLATALALTTGFPMVLVRKHAKEYGTEKFAEGPPIEGRRLCVIEDVVTTGGQLIASTEDLRRAGATVDDALCVIQRDERATELLGAAGIRLHALFQMDELI